MTYASNHVCAVRGSTVNISCTFTHPSDQRVTSRFWFIKEFKDLTSVPEYSGRVESICDDNNKCTLTIRNLTESDSADYKFRFTTDKDKWIGQPGVSLTVTGKVFFCVVMTPVFST